MGTKPPPAAAEGSRPTTLTGTASTAECTHSIGTPFTGGYRSSGGADNEDEIEHATSQDPLLVSA